MIQASSKEPVVGRLPDFIRDVATKGELSGEIAKLKMRLKAIKIDDKDKNGVIYTTPQFIELFQVKDGKIKPRLHYIKAQLKAMGIKRTRSYYDSNDGRIYFWENKAGKKENVAA